MVELLLANRADATKCSNDGTATDIAYSKDHIKVCIYPLMTLCNDNSLFPYVPILSTCSYEDVLT